jgi:hypothetical protein
MSITNSFQTSFRYSVRRLTTAVQITVIICLIQLLETAVFSSVNIYEQLIIISFFLPPNLLHITSKHLQYVVRIFSCEYPHLISLIWALHILVCACAWACACVRFSLYASVSLIILYSRSRKLKTNKCDISDFFIYNFEICVRRSVAV